MNMMTPQMKKSYEAPEVEVFEVKLDNFCETNNQLMPMYRPEDL